MLKATYRRVRAVLVVSRSWSPTVLVSTVAIDLGPALRARAEREGSKWLDRPMHIGRLGVADRRAAASSSRTSASTA